MNSNLPQLLLPSLPPLNVNTAKATSLLTPPLRAATSTTAGTAIDVCMCRMCVSIRSDNNNNTATAAATGVWSDLVNNDEFVTPGECGWFITCSVCLGKGVNRGTVPSRDDRPFHDRKWIEHVSNKGHKKGVQNIMAERERAKKKGRRNQFSMTAFFDAKKKDKKKTDSTPTVAAVAATEVVVLSADR